jgi:hypothetical protein
MEENDGYNYYYPYKYNQYSLYDNYVNGNIYPSQNYYYDNGIILKKNNDKKATNIIYFQNNYPNNNNPKEPILSNKISRIKSFYNNLSEYSKQNSSNTSQLFIKRNNSQFHMNNKYRIINDNYNTEIKNNNSNYFINNNVYQPEINNNIIYYSPRIINNQSQKPNNFNKTEIVNSYDINMNMNYNKSEKNIFTKNETSRNNFNAPKANNHRKLLFKYPAKTQLKPLDNKYNNNEIYYDSIYNNSLNKYANNQTKNNSIHYNESNYYKYKNSQNSNNNSNYYLNTDNISNVYPPKMLEFNKSQISSNMINKSQNSKKTIITIYQNRGKNISDLNKMIEFNPTKNTQLEKYNKINLNKRGNHKSDLCLNCKKKQSQNFKEEFKEINTNEKPNKMNIIKNIKIIEHNNKEVEQNQKKNKEIKSQIFNNDRKRNVIIKVSNNYKFHEIKETSKSKKKKEEKEKDTVRNKEIGKTKLEQKKKYNNLTNRNKIPVNKSYYVKRTNNLNESNKKEEILKNSNEKNIKNQREKYYSIIKKNYELFLQSKNKKNTAIKKIPKNSEKKRKRQKSKNQLYFEKKLDRKKSMSFIEYIADYSPKNFDIKHNNIQKNKTGIKENLSHKKFKEDDGTFFMDEEILKLKNNLFDDKKTNFCQKNQIMKKNSKNANKIRLKKYSYNQLNIQIGCRFMIIKENIKNRIYCLNGKSIYFYSENLKKFNKIKDNKKS